MLFKLFSWAIPASDKFDRKDAKRKSSPDNQAIESIYFVLDVLDWKAAARMQLNGIVIAAGLVGVSSGVKFYTLHGWPFAITALSSIASMILSLQVVSVDWTFLGHANISQGGDDFSREVTYLRKVRLFRERAYQVAWALSLISACAFAYQMYSCVFN